jgi:phage terminase Nu1 subunit (DNA packaging protein)
MSDDSEMKTAQEPAAKSAQPVVAVSAKDLAAAFGIGTRRIQQLASDKEGNVVVRIGRDQYDMVASTQNYIEMIEQAATVAMTTGGKELKEEQTRLTSARADKAELELAILRGDAVLMPDVEALTSEEYGATRLSLSQISGGIARKLAQSSDPAVCQEIVADAIEGALKTLTADQPGGKRPRTRHLPGADGLDDDED